MKVTSFSVKIGVIGLIRAEFPLFYVYLLVLLQARARFVCLCYFKFEM